MHGASEQPAKIDSLVLRARTRGPTPTLTVPSALASPASASVQREASAHAHGVVELFAGSGGLALGLARAGLKSWDMIELNEPCCETLGANADILGWKEAGSVKARDVCEIDFRAYSGVDVVAAGAPCQPFSQAGGLRGQYDDRNMFPQVIRAIGEAQPRAFLLENVRGLLFKRAESYFKSVLARLRNPASQGSDTRLSDVFHFTAPPAGPDDEYVLHFALLNAADFGLAQNRPRLFIVGLRNGESAWSWPTGDFSRSSLVHALRSGAYWDEHARTPIGARAGALAALRIRDAPATGKRWRTLRDLTATLGPPAEPDAATGDHAHVLVPGARLYPKHTGSRLDWVAKTVKAGVHGTPGGEHIILLDDGTHRYLTVRECALLQGFPLEYALPEKRTPAMRQLGNAVPVAVAEALGEQLDAVLRHRD
jgi:DNA (cytosine-5)-methyltransferase 1